MGVIPKTRHLGRYREITGVLARHGFGWLLGEIRPRGLLPSVRRRERAEDLDPTAQAVHLRRAFEELGTTFIKLGQVLSTRSDILPPTYIAELVKLQDAVPPVPYAHVAAVVEAELGARPDQLFAAGASFSCRGEQLTLPRSWARMGSWTSNVAPLPSPSL